MQSTGEMCYATAHGYQRQVFSGSHLALYPAQKNLEWLRPFTDVVVRALAARHRHLLVATPGFAADCLETLEEIRIRLREGFHAAGGEELIVVPALNDHGPWLDAMAALVRMTAGNAADP